MFLESLSLFIICRLGVFSEDNWNTLAHYFSIMKWFGMSNSRSLRHQLKTCVAMSNFARKLCHELKAEIEKGAINGKSIAVMGYGAKRLLQEPRHVPSTLTPSR